MTTSVSIIRPGILVSLKSSVTGGVSYRRHNLEIPEEELPTKEEAEASRWETLKVVEDAEEHERAVRVRGQALAKIRKLCAITSFGYLCPQGTEDALNAATVEARAIVDEHNASAKYTNVYLYVLKGRIASTDEEAMRAIASEVKGLLTSMDNAIDKLDPKAIREAATKAREISAMLAPEQAEKVAEAVEGARKAAREITRRVTQNGEDAAVVLDDISKVAIANARFAFIDFDDPIEIPGDRLPSVEAARFVDGIDYAIGEGN